jgi:hypothetical protein
MIERTEKTFGIKPDCLVADTAYGAAQIAAKCLARLSS